MNSRYLTVVALLAAGVASVLSLIVGPGADYARIFPPPWLGLVAAALAAASVTVRCGRSGFGWAATAVFFGASGGVILDVFRAFFAVTGIPAGEFSTVDWPGAVSRAIYLVAAFATVLFTSQSARPPVRAGGRRMLAWGGVVLSVPYPLLKFFWWMQGHASVGFPIMELVSFGAAAIWVVLLTTPAGGRLPRFVLTIGGWLSSFALLSMGGLMVFGMLSQLTGLASEAVDFGSESASVIVFGVYGCWLALGVVMLASTLSFTAHRRNEVAV
ncbi:MULTISPECIES: hypothetical protein [Kribbella]|uniref:Uncharacterized protein n=1 Tax=Kribbella karoonensis TaxID=324851 RepID=A0ABN2D2I0_9ACTN